MRRITFISILILMVSCLLFGQTASKNYILYVPGAKKADPKADIEANGFKAGDSFNKHFSFVYGKDKKVKAIKVDTTDGVNDYFTIPLSGSEKMVTLIFKAKGAKDPDKGTPFGVLWAGWQKGNYTALLRHNHSNQIKGSTGQTNIKPDDIVSDWHEFRLVFNIEADGKAMTATAFVDGKERHKTANYVKELTEWGGAGNFLAVGENDGSTNGFARYLYFLVVKDEDVSKKSLADLSKTVNFDLTVIPELVSDKDPASKKPANKPATINMTAADASSKDEKYVDPAFIDKGIIDLAKLPYSKNAAQKVNAKPVLPDVKKINALIVDATGANGAYKTIASAIEAAKSGSVIFIKAGMYQEKLKITKENISLLGESPANTIIYGYESDTGGIDGNILVDVSYNGGSFNAENITFYNKGAEWNKTWGSSERRSITLCTRNVHNAYIKNCVFLGQQDTMYLRSGRQYFENCYIEGEVDFICGGATVLFNNCHIHSLFYANGGYIAAAAPVDTNGKSFENGYVFKACLFTTDPKMNSAKPIFLGRGAWKGGSTGTGQAKVVIISSLLEGKYAEAGWTDWDNVDTAAKQFFREYKNTGASSIKMASETRLFLKAGEFKKNFETTEKILGFTPKMPY